MSVFLSSADTLADYLNASGALDGVEVVVDRQKNISSKINTTVNKATGAVITVLWSGGKNINPNGKAVFANSYLLRVYAKPVMRDGNVPADTLIESLVNLVHDWTPDTALANAVQRRYQVVDVDLIPDEKYLIYEVLATFTTPTN